MEIVTDLVNTRRMHRASIISGFGCGEGLGRGWSQEGGQGEGDGTGYGCGTGSGKGHYRRGRNLGDRITVGTKNNTKFIS